MENFALGSASSLFAAFIIYASRNIWSKWWHLLLAKNYPRIAGRYRFDFKLREGAEYQQVYGNDKFFLDLNQVGKKISGFYEFYDEDDLKHKFPLHGTVGLDRSIIISYESDDPTYIAKGTMLIRFRGPHTYMSGTHTFICLKCEHVHAVDIELHKAIKP